MSKSKTSLLPINTSTTVMLNKIQKIQKSQKKRSEEQRITRILVFFATITDSVCSAR